MGLTDHSAHLTPELVDAMARAAGMPIPPEHLETSTSFLDALYQLDALLARRNLDSIIPELRWDARWSSESENNV